MSILVSSPDNVSSTVSLIDITTNKTVIPEYKKAANLVFVRDRWKCDTTWIDRAGHPDRGRFDLDNVIISLAQNFIPAVSCLCDKGTSTDPPHGDGLYMPTLAHTVAPNYQFALIEQSQSSMLKAAQAKIEQEQQVDLDETTSVSEYCAVFERALRFEYEEHLRLYELYSLYHVHIEPVIECPHPGGQLVPGAVFKQAKIVVDGIADARPTLQVGDIVLLRPIPTHGAVSLEIESRIVAVTRGSTKTSNARKKKKEKKSQDQIILTWGLNHEQSTYLELKHSPNVNKIPKIKDIRFNVRFIPSAVPLERCLTALDWLKNVSKLNPQALGDVLFPVKAPEVKPLSVNVVNRMRQDNSDIDNPLNELQSSFVKMVGARTRDPEYNMVRPPMILTGPAGEQFLDLFSFVPNLNENMISYIDVYLRHWQNQDTYGSYCRCSRPQSISI